MSFEFGKKKKKKLPDCFLPRSPLIVYYSVSEITIIRYMCNKGPIQAQKSKRANKTNLQAQISARFYWRNSGYAKL